MFNSRTTLKAIKEAAMNDFGVRLSNEQAKDIRQSFKTGSAVWTRERFVSVANSPTIKRMDSSGVQYLACGAFYTTFEWNKEYATL
jgi:hypothetical protein